MPVWEKDQIRVPEIRQSETIPHNPELWTFYSLCANCCLLTVQKLNLPMYGGQQECKFGSSCSQSAVVYFYCLLMKRYKTGPILPLSNEKHWLRSCNCYWLMIEWLDYH